MLPVVLCGLREEQRLRVFEIRLLRKLFGPKWDKLIFQNEELHDLYSSPNTILVIKSR